MIWRALMLGAALLTLGACAGEIDNADELLRVLDGGAIGGGDGGAIGGGDAGDAPADAAVPSDGGATGNAACAALGVTDPFVDLVAPTCATAGCHGQGAMQGGLSLEGDLTLLVDQPANTAACASRPLIDSTAIEDSVMLQVLEPNPPCSSPMPFPLGGLSQDQKDCIRAWAESLVQDAE